MGFKARKTASTTQRNTSSTRYAFAYKYPQGYRGYDLSSEYPSGTLEHALQIAATFGVSIVLQGKDGTKLGSVRSDGKWSLS